jgi:RNA polymerase sigma-70 factor (ECF subfamily)
MQDSHAQLVGRATTGDAEALGALLERHLPGLVTFVRARAGEHLRAREETLDLALSACREVLVDVAEQRHLDEAGFRSWLFLAAERKIADKGRFYRRERRDGDRTVRLLDASGLGPVAHGPSPSEELGAREDWAQVEEALAVLPEDYREVILLTRVIGLSHAEAGEALGRSEGATRMLLSRALGRLARAMPRPAQGSE